MNIDGVHPRWDALLDWLASHGMRRDEIHVVARKSPGAGYGLFTNRTIEQSTPLFSIPAKALLNSLTLAPHYPTARPSLSCTQFVSLHLLLHRPLDGLSDDPLFGPYISVLPLDFDSHPLTWLWKEDKLGRGATTESQLLDTLPPHTLAKLNKIFGLFKMDWDIIQGYLQKNPTVADIRASRTGSNNTAEWEGDYLWGWLNVNTRCVYHRLKKSRSSPDNMTLCPILDFANHTKIEPFTWPRATQAEIWDSGPSPKRKFGDNFVLLSPSATAVASGNELFLRYGIHANSTLFSEYGFISVDDISELEGEIEVDKMVENMFSKRGVVGSWMRDALVDEGYWGDWTMNTSPVPAHPSYRLITALRLYHALPDSVRDVPSNGDKLLQEWRNTTLGNQDMLSQNNENLWRAGLLLICEELMVNAKRGISKVGTIEEGNGGQSWLLSAKHFIRTLWEEQMQVARGVVNGLEMNVEF